MNGASLTTRSPTGGSGLCSRVRGPGPRSPRQSCTHVAFTDGAHISLPPGAIRVGLAIHVGALGRAEPRLKFLYLQSQRVRGQPTGVWPSPCPPRDTAPRDGQGRRHVSAGCSGA